MTLEELKVYLEREIGVEEGYLKEKGGHLEQEELQRKREYAKGRRDSYQAVLNRITGVATW